MSQATTFTDGLTWRAVYAQDTRECPGPPLTRPSLPKDYSCKKRKEEDEGEVAAPAATSATAFGHVGDVVQLDVAAAAGEGRGVGQVPQGSLACARAQKRWRRRTRRSSASSSMPSPRQLPAPIHFGTGPACLRKPPAQTIHALPPSFRLAVRTSVQLGPWPLSFIRRGRAIQFISQYGEALKKDEGI